MEEREIETRIRRLLMDHRVASRVIRDMGEKPSLFGKAPLETLDRHVTLSIVGLLHADLADRIDAALKEYRVAATAFAGANPVIFDREEALDLLERAVAHEIVGMLRADPAPVVDPCDTPSAVRPWAGGTDRGRIKGVLARFAEAVAAGCRAYRGPELDAHLGDLVEEASRQVCDLMGDAPAPVAPGVRTSLEAVGIQVIDITPFNPGQAVEVFDGKGWEPGIVETVRTTYPFPGNPNPEKVHVFSVLREDGRSLLAGASMLRRRESYSHGQPITPKDVARLRAAVDRLIEAEVGTGDGDTREAECQTIRFAMVAPWGTWERGTLVGIDGTGDAALCTLKLDSGEVLTATRPQLKALEMEGKP